jgi:SAM-dependent methyltransferase
MSDEHGDLQAYYARDEERDRLGAGLGRVEFERSVEIIGRTLPTPPARVADIGGGPGRYTDWLVGAGYDVAHRDLVAHHVDQVSQRHGDRVDAAVGDARQLDLADASVDAALLLGPIYHLSDRDDRVTALREARRVVRPGGYVYVAAITRWAARLHGMIVQRVHEKFPAIATMVDAMEESGWMKPVHEASFTGYAHTPTQLRDEIEAAGLTVESFVGVEGIAFALGDLDERMNDDEQRAFLLDMLRAVESVPDLLGLGPHLLVTARA